MTKDMTLLIMAAGMGSRFGGLKQIEPVGPSREFMIDYSIYDALIAGFNKVVFVIKEENYETFKETIGRRVEPYIHVEYCFQDLNKLPEGYLLPEGREKPWGTAHAILAAKDLIHENFAIINADDFYGREAFIDAANYLQELDEPNKYAIIGYQVENTLTENGSVKRAVLFGEGGMLDTLIESHVEKKNGAIIATPLDGGDSFTISSEHPVSLNMFCFSPSIFKHIEDNFIPFMESHKEDNMTCEYLIPDLVRTLMDHKEITVELIPTTATWVGVTYKDDLPGVIAKIREEVKLGKYAEDLWSDLKNS